MTVWSDLTDSERKSCCSDNLQPDKTLTVNAFKKIEVWEIKGQLLEEWNNSVLPSIVDIANQTYFSDQFFPRKRHRRSCALPVWSLYIVKSKSDPTKAAPTIFALHKDVDIARKASKLIETLKYRSYAVALQDYQIAYAQKTIHLHGDEHGSNLPNGLTEHHSDEHMITPLATPPGQNLCGAHVLICSEMLPGSDIRASERWSQSTIGACMFIDARRFGLTTAHGFAPEDESDPSSDGLHGFSSQDGSTTAEQNSRDLVVHNVFASSCDEGTVVDPETLLLPKQHPDLGSIINGTGNTDITSSKTDTEVICNFDYDWALIPVLNPLYPAYKQVSLGVEEELKIRGITSKPASTEVMIGNSASHKRWFDFHNVTVALSLPHSERIHIAWRLEQRTAPGDCGALVFDRNGDAFAMVIAGSEDDGETYCLPLQPMLETMVSQMGLLGGPPRLLPDPSAEGGHARAGSTAEASSSEPSATIDRLEDLPTDKRDMATNSQPPTPLGGATDSHVGEVGAGVDVQNRQDGKEAAASDVNKHTLEGSGAPAASGSNAMPELIRPVSHERRRDANKTVALTPQRGATSTQNSKDENSQLPSRITEDRGTGETELRPSKRSGKKRVSRKDILPESLDHYRVPWSWDPNDDFYIWIHDHITKDRLWDMRQHTLKLQQQKNASREAPLRGNNVVILPEEAAGTVQADYKVEGYHSMLAEIATDMQEKRYKNAQLTIAGPAQVSSRFVAAKQGISDLHTDIKNFENTMTARQLDRQFEADMLKFLWQNGVSIEVYDQLLKSHIHKGAQLEEFSRNLQEGRAGRFTTTRETEVHRDVEAAQEPGSSRSQANEHRADSPRGVEIIYSDNTAIQAERTQR